MHKTLVIFGLILGLGFLGNAHAEHNPRQLGEAMSMYLNAVNIMSRVKQHECGYLVVDKYSFRNALDEATRVLNQDEKKVLMKMVHDGVFEQYSSRIYAMYERAYERNMQKVHDKDQVCRDLTSKMKLGIYRPAVSKWEYARDHYVR